MDVEIEIEGTGIRVSGGGRVLLDVNDGATEVKRGVVTLGGR